MFILCLSSYECDMCLLFHGKLTLCFSKSLSQGRRKNSPGLIIVVVVVQSLHCIWLATPWTAASKSPLPMGFSRWEYGSGLPCPSPDGDQIFSALYLKPLWPWVAVVAVVPDIVRPPLSYWLSPHRRRNHLPSWSRHWFVAFLNNHAHS